MEVLEFKDPLLNDRTGLLTIKGPRGFQLVAAGEAPLVARKPQAPLECLSVEAFNDKGRGQLSLAVKLTPQLWLALHALDLLFDAFMVKHAAKLFSASDAKYIKDDPKSISLKHPKPLARYNVDGTPNSDGYINLRIYGRGPDVDSFVVKDGREGPYVALINYKDRTEGLGPHMSRFMMCTGTLPDGKRSVVETTRIVRATPDGPGQPRMRYVSPGDFTGGNLLSVVAVPQHWAIVNGSASMCFKLQQCVFENIDAAVELPDGFVLAAEEAPSSAPLPLGPAMAPAPKRMREEEPAHAFKAASEQLDPLA